MDEIKNVSSDRKYEFALQLLFYEGQIAWQLNILFIGLNVGIGSIIQDKLDKINLMCPILIIMSFIGIILNVMWLGTFRRNNKYYKLRMAQAREAENEEWKLLKGDGYKFSKGNEIMIEDKTIDIKDRNHRLKWFEKLASNKKAIGTAIWLFILAFALLFIFSLRAYVCS